jgi:hypothetical protein
MMRHKAPRSSFNTCARTRLTQNHQALVAATSGKRSACRRLARLTEGSICASPCRNRRVQ